MTDQASSYHPSTMIQGKKQRRYLTCGCFGLVALFVAFMFVYTFAHPLFPDLPFLADAYQTQVNAYESLWREQNIDHYALEIRYGRGVGSDTMEFSIIVEEGQIISIESQVFDFGFYRQFTVEELFASAHDCLSFCVVEFNDEFGFPDTINHTGFIESGSNTQIVNFRPITR